MRIDSLNEAISLNSNFKTAVNLYLSLNNTEKVLNYIPTKSSMMFLDGYIQAIISQKEQATLMIGPYGKGKSHLLLVLLAILSLERTEKNNAVIDSLKKRIADIDEEGERIAENIALLWEKKRLLPVIINDTNGDLNQSFLNGIYEALKRENLLDLAPDTYYSIAIERIKDWEQNYKPTYKQFATEAKKLGFDPAKMLSELKLNSRDALDAFTSIYPRITAGSTFNPMAESEVLPLYKGVADRLVEEKGFGGIYIVFDEFSKFIEGLNGRSVGSNMKILQDMCELATESTNADIFITMVAHKSIKEYGKYLSTEIINAFTGIEGRIIEKFFVSTSKNNYELIRHAIVKDWDKLKLVPGGDGLFGKKAMEKYYKLPMFSGLFKADDFERIILRGCYPLSPVAAYMLLNISEKVAQNERTLFTFISNDEPNSMARFVLNHSASDEWAIGADLIYDYFSGLFKKDVTNELIHGIWLGAEAALAKCETDDERKIIKTMALIQIINKPDEIASNESILINAVINIDLVSLENLAGRQVIYKKASTGAYVFKTRAGIELRSEIKKQKEIKGDNINYSLTLGMIDGRQFIIPRRYNMQHSMTRYFAFEYMDVETFLNISDASAFLDDASYADGKVLNLYSFSSTKQAEVKKHLKELQCRNLIVVSPQKCIGLIGPLREYDILQDLRKNHVFLEDNDVYRKEIPLLEEDIESIVEKQLEEIYVDDSDCKIFAYDDKIVTYESGNEENAVNDCCATVYSKTPRINNEIINREYVNTAQTKKTRLTIISELLKADGKVEEDFYDGTNQEATIFRSLFVNTGVIVGKADQGLNEVLEKMEGFIDSCCDEKRSLKSIIADLHKAPYGMRLGVIPMFLAYQLAQRNEDLVVYYYEKEIQMTAETIVNMCEHADAYSLFVPKADKEREDYIKALNELFSVKEARNLTDNRIKNIVVCMQRWFRSLPQVARNAANVEVYENQDTTSKMFALKKMLQQIEVNSYELIFVDIPQTFGCKTYCDAFGILKDCKALFDQHLDRMTETVVKCIYDVFGGKKKRELYHVLKEWYDAQSQLSKQGLHSGKITSFMSSIDNLEVYNDEEVAIRIAKTVTDVYLENWTNEVFKSFKDDLAELKKEIEEIKPSENSGRNKLSFKGRDGKTIEKYYECVDESTGMILRNILEDTLDEFSDLSVNDRVAILLEMIEKTIG